MSLKMLLEVINRLRLYPAQQANARTCVCNGVLGTFDFSTSLLKVCLLVLACNDLRWQPGSKNDSSLKNWHVLSSLCSFWQQLSQRKVWAHLWTCAVTIATRLWRPSRLSPPPRHDPPWRTLPPPSPNFDLDSRTPASKWRLRQRDWKERRVGQSSIKKRTGGKTDHCVFCWFLYVPFNSHLDKICWKAFQQKRVAGRV